MKKILKYSLLMVLLLSLIVRLIVLNQSLWLDEAIGAIVAKTFSFKDVLIRFPLSDNHPPLYYLMLKAWSSIFGYSEISLRLPSVIFGILTVYFVYKIAKDFSKINPIIPSVFLATSPLAIYYSQEARMYTLAGFSATVAIYFFLKTFGKSARWMDWIWFCVSYTSLIFIDYMPIFLYPVFLIYPLILKKDWNWWKKFVFANIPLLILGVLWLPIFFKQGTNGRWLLTTLPAWRNVAGGATFKELGIFWSKFVFGRISLFNKPLYYSLIFLSSMPILISLARLSKKIKESVFFWLWFVTPVALGFLISFSFPAFIYFRYIFILPAFYLLISIGAFSYKKIGRYIITIIIVFNLIGWGIYVLNRKEHREDWRGAVSYVEENARADEAAIFENPEPFAPYRWYSKGKVDSFGMTDSISANKDKTRVLVKNRISGKTGTYYFEYLKNLEDPGGIVQNTLSEMGFVETDRKDFNGVGFVIHYQKKQTYAYKQSLLLENLK